MAQFSTKSSIFIKILLFFSYTISSIVLEDSVTKLFMVSIVCCSYSQFAFIQFSPLITITGLTIRWLTVFELLPPGARREPLLKKPSEEL